MLMQWSLRRASNLKAAFTVAQSPLARNGLSVRESSVSRRMCLTTQDLQTRSISTRLVARGHRLWQHSQSEVVSTEACPLVRWPTTRAYAQPCAGKLIAHGCKTALTTTQRWLPRLRRPRKGLKRWARKSREALD